MGLPPLTDFLAPCTICFQMCTNDFYVTDIFWREGAMRRRRHLWSEGYSSGGVRYGILAWTGFLGARGRGDAHSVGRISVITKSWVSSDHPTRTS